MVHLEIAALVTGGFVLTSCIKGDRTFYEMFNLVMLAVSVLGSSPNLSYLSVIKVLLLQTCVLVEEYLHHLAVKVETSPFCSNPAHFIHNSTGEHKTALMLLLW